MKIVLGRPRDIQKHAAILDAAKALFLEFGYDGSSMDKIAKHAGVTKITVYNHFNDKETLFTAAISKYCEEALAEQNFVLHAEDDFRTALAHVGALTLQTIYRPEAMKLHILLLQLGQTNPALAQRFYAASHQRLQGYLEQFFQQAHDLAHLNCPNAHNASQVFLAMLINPHYNQVLLQIQPIPDQVGLDALLDQAIAVVMALFKTKV